MKEIKRKNGKWKKRRKINFNSSDFSMSKNTPDLIQIMLIFLENFHMTSLYYYFSNMLTAGDRIFLNNGIFIEI